MLLLADESVLFSLPHILFKIYNIYMFTYDHCLSIYIYVCVCVCVCCSSCRSVSGGVVIKMGGKGVKSLSSYKRIEIDVDVVERIKEEAREAEAKALGLELEDEEGENRLEEEEEDPDEW
jgi:hypothetical protein